MCLLSISIKRRSVISLQGMCHEKFGLGVKNGPRTVFAAKNGPRTKLALQNVVHVGKFGLLVY